MSTQIHGGHDIQDATITDAKIVSMSWNKLSGSPLQALSIVGAGAIPSSLIGSPFQLTVNQATFGAGSIPRLENNATAAGAALRVDFLCGSVSSNYLYGSIQAKSPTAADPTFLMGSGTAHDLILVTAGAEIFRFNRAISAAGPYFVMFGGTTNAWPAFKRESADIAFYKADHTSGYTGVRALQYALGDPATDLMTVVFDWS